MVMKRACWIVVILHSLYLMAMRKMQVLDVLKKVSCNNNNSNNNNNNNNNVNDYCMLLSVLYIWTLMITAITNTVLEAGHFELWTPG